MSTTLAEVEPGVLPTRLAPRGDSSPGIASSKPSPPAARLLHLDVFRAAAASFIAWHHFTSYPPLAEWAASAAGGWIEWVHDHTRVAQVFFVVSGFVLSQTMMHRVWNLRQARRFVLYRYCRLGLPYLAAIVLAILASSLARGKVPDEVLGAPVAPDQLAAHLVFLQHILGYESLSAGLWFVCINFQLGLILVGLLLLRDGWSPPASSSRPSLTSDIPLAAGFVLATASLFYFNRSDQWDAWAVYFFAQFYVGLAAHQAVRSPRARIYLVCFLLAMVAALCLQWRARLLTSLITAGVLFALAKYGRTERWPEIRVVQWLGKTSYSLFLVHFPVLLVVSAAWMELGLSTGWWGVVGLVVTYLASLATAGLFYTWVERPAHQLSRRFAHDGPALVRAPAVEAA